MARFRPHEPAVHRKFLLVRKLLRFAVYRLPLMYILLSEHCSLMINFNNAAECIKYVGALK